MSAASAPIPARESAAPEVDVSIVIPYHNNRAMTEACLDSVVLNTAGVTYELILIDDAGTEAPDLARLPSSIPVTAIRNERRRTYSQNNNEGARRASGRYLCLLNNDTLVRPRWLRNMLEVIRADPRIGVLGNKHLFPGNGLLHHAGMAFDDKGFPWHIHPHTDPGLPAVNYPREAPCVTFACVLIPAAVYRACGGLDEVFRNGFEDCDFCLRASAAGHRIVYTPASVIEHYGQATEGRQDADDANWKTFKAKWAGQCTSTFETLVREDRAYNRMRASHPRLRPPPQPGLHLAVDFSIPSAFSWAGADLAVALDQAGYPFSLPSVTRIHSSIERAKARILRRHMRQAPKGSCQVKWSHYWPAHLKQPLHGEVNAEFFCTNYRYRAEGRRLDLWMRHVQANGYRKLPVSQFNREALLEIGIPEGDCISMPLGYSPEIDGECSGPSRAPRSDRPDLHLLLVTNSHDLQRYGTDLAIKALAQAFGPEDPVVVHIKDYNAPVGRDVLREWIAAEKRFPRIQWHREFLSKQDLLRLYADMDVQLAPFRGEGFAMKIIDAMALGVPVMMPAFGGPTDYLCDGAYLPIAHDLVPVGSCSDREFYYLGDGAYWCEPRVEDLVRQLAALPGKREELSRIGAKAREHVRGRFTWARAAARLAWALETWQGERALTVSTRRGPDERELSVVIPTRNRPEVLAMTLAAYRKQTLPAAQFELVIVNDHGDRAPLEAAVMKAGCACSIRLLDNPGPVSPGSARNPGIEAARGEIVLFTGDDIVPAPDFLEWHLKGHRRHPALETGFVGLNLWHPDLPLTPFHETITGEGGHQFNYRGMKDGHVTTFDRFYTSNCSLKRAFLAEEERLFNEFLVMHEDKELAYRLHLKGFELRFAAKAKGYHYHEMDPRSFLGRQRKVGEMLTHLAFIQPSYMPAEHAAFLRALEFHRVSNTAPDTAVSAQDPDRFLEALLGWYESALTAESPLKGDAATAIARQDGAAWLEWLREGYAHGWEAMNELALRLGMAEGWSMSPADTAAAKAWIGLVTLPRILGPSGNQYWSFPYATDMIPGVLFPHSRLIYALSNALRQNSLAGPLLKRFEQSALGRKVRAALLRTTGGP